MSAVVLTPNAHETEHVTGFKGQSLFKPSTHMATVVLLLSTKRLHQTIGSMHISPLPLDDQKNSQLQIPEPGRGRRARDWLCFCWGQVLQQICSRLEKNRKERTFLKVYNKFGWTPKAPVLQFSHYIWSLAQVSPCSAEVQIQSTLLCVWMQIPALAPNKIMSLQLAINMLCKTIHYIDYITI